MPQLWLVPADAESYLRTLASPVDLSDAPDKPAAFPDEARVWGVRTDPAQGSWDRNRRNLERMEPGDPLLVYRNGEGQYVGRGEVGPFWHTEYVRDTFWNGGPALDVFAVEDYREIDVPTSTVNRLLDYKEGFVPQGLWRVADDRPVTKLLQRLE